MHELSLAQNLIEQLEQLAKEHQAKRILRVTVTIGSFSGIVADSFVFGFDALKLEKPLIQAAVLDLDVPLPSYKCLACGHVQLVARDSQQQEQPFGLPGTALFGDALKCTACDSPRLLPEGGDELILKQIEME